MRYCSKCIIMKEPWCLYNTMTERWTFLYVVIQKSEFFTKSWRSRKQLVEAEMQAPEGAREDTTRLLLT